MSRERLLVSTLLELADTMVEDYDVVDLLYLLCDRAVEIVSAAAAGVLLMNGTGRLEVAAATSREMREVEQLEATRSEGPCVDAHLSGAPVDCGDLEGDDERWPEVSSVAAAHGFRSVHARPLLLRGQSIGALNVFSPSVGRFDDDDAAVLAGLADMAAIGIVNERKHLEAEVQIANLQAALDRRAVVDQAVAVLADRVGLDQGIAFDVLRRYARNHNQPLRDVAHRFMAGQLEVGALDLPTRG